MSDQLNTSDRFMVSGMISGFPSQSAFLYVGKNSSCPTWIVLNILSQTTTASSSLPKFDTTNAISTLNQNGGDHNSRTDSYWITQKASELRLTYIRLPANTSQVVVFCNRNEDQSVCVFA